MSATPAPSRAAVWISATLVTAAVALVLLSLRREPPVTYPLTEDRPVDAAGDLVGPRRVTLDTSDPDRWVLFDLDRGATVPTAAAGWDLAFRRFNVLVNGGARFDGDAAVADAGVAPFESVVAAPDTGWVQAPEAGRDSANPAIARWYDYSFTSHLLTPKPRTYLIRTTGGHFAKLRFLSYYCPGATPGCMSFEYVYQGDGSRRLDAP